MKTKILAFFVISAILFLNSCKKDDQEEKITPIATANPVSQSISAGTSTAISLSSSATGSTFSWTVVQAGVSGATAGSGTNINQTLNLTGTAVGTATYTVIPTLNGVSGAAITVVITVNPLKTTYLANIKPLFAASCTPCHMQGGTHPSKFDDYTTAKNKINSILDRVQRTAGTTGFMPAGGTKLSTENIALLNKWVADGLLEK